MRSDEVRSFFGYQLDCELLIGWVQVQVVT